MEPIRIPEDRKVKTIKSLVKGEIAWVSYDTMVVELERCFINSAEEFRKRRSDDFPLRIKKTFAGFIAYINTNNYLWPDSINSISINFDYEDLVPVIAFSDRDFVRKEKDLNIEFYQEKIILLEDKIRIYLENEDFELARKATDKKEKYTKILEKFLIKSGAP